MIRKLLFVAPLLVLSACAGQNHTMLLDDKSGMYATPVKVDAASVQVFDSSIDPRRFPYVLLATDTNLRADNFEFTIRKALAQAGLMRVFSVDEFKLLAHDKGFALVDGEVTNDALRRFSSQVGPVLVVSMSHRLLPDMSREHMLLQAGDAATGKALLRVDRTNPTGSDDQTLYPMLNELRRWVKDSSKGNT